MSMLPELLDLRELITHILKLFFLKLKERVPGYVNIFSGISEPIYSMCKLLYLLFYLLKFLIN